MKKYITIFSIIVILVGCTKNFEEINTSPLALSYINPEYLMTNTLRRGALDDRSFFYTQGIANFYMQYLTSVRDEFNWNLDAYYQNDNWYGTMWKYWYASQYDGYLAIVNEAQKLAVIDGQPNIIAPTHIWKVFLYQRLTDCFGDISYSEAFNDDINFPKYDDQKDIYYDMIAKLTTATNMMTSESSVIYGDGDLLYQGNITKWKRFSNSLRLRMAMRMVKVEPAKAQQEFEAALMADGEVMTSNSDNAKIFPDPTGPAGIHSQNPLRVFASAFDWMRVSESFIDKLQSTNDPRIFNYVDPTLNFVTKTLSGKFKNINTTILSNTDKEYVTYVIANTGSLSAAYKQGSKFIPTAIDFLENTIHLPAFEIQQLRNGQYIGAPNGYPLDKLNTIQGELNDMSDYGQYVQGVNHPCYLMVYPEVCFLKAEAALRSWNVGGSAEQFYNEGVRAALELFEVPENDIQAYFDGAAKFNTAGTNEQKLEQIITQKYLANYLNGFESWAEWRRTGYPALNPIQTDEGGTGSKTAVPRRFLYIQDEKILNEANVNSARENQIKYSNTGEYNLLTPVWWDQNYENSNF